ncbi:MAG: hypothetical protein ABIQ62_03775 [Thermomonas sp.]
MPLTLGTTGMDSKTEAGVRAAFSAANEATGRHWALVEGDAADFVVVDMDSLYGPMSWLRLHAAGRKVIGLTSMERCQTDFRLGRPVDAEDFTALLGQLAGEMPPAPAAAAPAASTPAPAPSDHLPEPQALPVDEVEAMPAEAPAMAAPLLATPEPEGQAIEPESELEPNSAATMPRDRPLASWLAENGIEHRVRLKRDDGPALLLDPRNKVYHGPTTLKPLANYFDGTLVLEDFATLDAATWDSETAALGAAQPLARLQWLGGLLAGRDGLDGQYRLNKWPQTEREYPKHFRIATAMMKAPSTVDEVVAACGVDRTEVADFVNANLATGYAELVLHPTLESEQPVKSNGGLFGRIRGR